MDAYLPFFPLKLVAFPGEEVNLHIFEPRYKQLIRDCMEKSKTFGICVFLDKIMPLGTEVELLEVVRVYEDGRMDIKTKAMRIFSVLDFVNPSEGKLYAGGNVRYLENNTGISPAKFKEFVFLLKELLLLLNAEISIDTEELNSFSYAHKIGLKMDQEYVLISMTSEEERVEFLMEHCNRVIPIIQDIENARKKIRLNGHFKYLDPLNF